MSAKDGLKLMIDKFIEDALHSSNYMKLLTKNLTLIATETKKLAEFVLLVNDRLNQHEQLLLKLTSQQKEPVSYLDKTDKKSSKPN
jgi:hypothetical protein